METTITILLFASLRERLQIQRLQLEWTQGSLAELRTAMASRGANWSDFADSSRVRAAVNQVMATEATPVRPGDEVAFFPPVTGG